MAEVDRLEEGQSSTLIEIRNDDWMVSIMAERDSPPEKAQQIIGKVPPELREAKQNKGFFDPRVVSIGPYHRTGGAKPELKEAEKLKTRAACAFIAESKREPHEFYNKMFEVVSYARNCYLPGSTDAYDDIAFARMMLLDGCFVLHFIDAIVHEKAPFLDQLVKHVGISGVRAIIVDIILLENQLPFRVLQELISTGYPEECQGEQLIENFIFKIFIDNMASWREQTYKHEREQPFHLLELKRKRFLGSQAGKLVDQSFCNYCFKRGHTRQTNQVKDGYSYSFRSATELKAKGIHFRPSNTFYLNDFGFTSQFGYGLLTLPQLAFGWGMKYSLLNMTAYELTDSTCTNDLEVCNYIYFMNSLINGAEDVIELRSHNIIHNFYGTDEEVAKSFNSMAIGGAFLSFQGPIKDANDQLQEHYNSRMRTWTAQLLHNYFSTPWSAIAFVAATFGLILTVLQTFHYH